MKYYYMEICGKYKMTDNHILGFFQMSEYRLVIGKLKAVSDKSLGLAFNWEKRIVFDRKFI